METTTYECVCCEMELSTTEVIHFIDAAYCENCFEEETFICERCGERHTIDTRCGDDSTELCESCYYDNYTRCDNCGRLLRNYDAYYLGSDEFEDTPYCYHCYDEKNMKTFIHEYSYKPEPIFYGDGNRFFGVELEIDNGGDSNDNAEAILEIANDSVDHLYCKHDSSIDDGFEMVTHPMSLDYHVHKMPWETTLTTAVEMGYLSHKASTCGLHIHINRNTFGDTYTEQEDCIARVLYFVENHWQELLKFSRRTPGQLEKWASRYGGADNPKSVLDSAKNSMNGRYTCVNLQNYATIEFRIFRGTLLQSTLIATLQLVDEICNVAFSLSDDEIAQLTWFDFVRGLNMEKVPQLIRYLKTKQLYVSEGK